MAADKRKRILFVVEGLKREMGIFRNISSVFFGGKSDVIAIAIPADRNIYMLYETLKEDDFETDIVEIIREEVPQARSLLEGLTREDFAEVYLFFDFDEHSNNLKRIENVEALARMLQTFDNETEHGKLYISYPMVEAVRDYVAGDCKSASGSCFCHRDEFTEYKEKSSIDPAKSDVAHYDFKAWNEAIANYIHRAACLFAQKELIRESFVETVSPASIFGKEMEIYSRHKEVFILSCLPEFLIDYSEKHWSSALKRRKHPISHSDCEKHKK